jgi:hypothetical protein
VSAERPEMLHDLPEGGRRLVVRAQEIQPHHRQWRDTIRQREA